MSSTTTETTAEAPATSGVLRRNTDAAVEKAKGLYSTSIAPKISGSTKAYADFKTTYPTAGSKLDRAEKRLGDVVDKAIVEGERIIDKVDGVIDAVEDRYQTVVKPRVDSVSSSVKTSLNSEEVQHVRTSGGEFASSISALILAVAIRTVALADAKIDPDHIPDNAQQPEPATLPTLTKRTAALAGKIHKRTIGALALESPLPESKIDEHAKTIMGETPLGTPPIGQRLRSAALYSLAVMSGAAHVVSDKLAPKYEGPAAGAVHQLTTALDRAMGWLTTTADGADKSGVVHPGETVGVLPGTPAGSSSSLNSMGVATS